MIKIAAIALVAVAIPAAAHHSHALYRSETIDIEGTIQKTLYINPHSLIYLDVTGKDGKVTTWGLEFNGPGWFPRIGTDKDYLQPGDKVKVRCLPLRNGAPGCVLGWIQGRDGKVYDYDGNKAPPVADGFFDGPFVPGK